MKWRLLTSVGLLGVLALGSSIAGHARQRGDHAAAQRAAEAPSRLTHLARAQPLLGDGRVTIKRVPRLAPIAPRRHSRIVLPAGLAGASWSLASYLTPPAALMLDIPCSQYEIPPPECADESEGDGSYQNDSYYDSQNFPYPARFNLRLTRFRGRLARPSFGAEVAHEIEQEGGAA